MKPPHLVLVSLLFAAGISLPGLGRHPFWDDEASTALIGRNFIRTGTLTAWDGRNLNAYGMRGEIDLAMKKRSPPLQYVLVGVSMVLFGETEAGGRILCWLIGLGSIPLLALWYRNAFGRSNWWVAGFVLAASVTFLLFIRQARYFGPALTFSSGLLWSWSAAVRGRRIGLWTAIGAGFFALLLWTHYLSALAAIVIVALGLLEQKSRNRSAWVFLGAMGAVGLLGLVWFSFQSRGTAPQGFSAPIRLVGRLVRFSNLCAMSSRDAVRFELVPVGMLLFALPGAAVLRRDALPYLKQIGLLFVYGLGAILAVSFFNPQPFASTDSDAHVRHYLVLIPIGAAMAAVVFDLCRATGVRLLAPGFLAVLLSSNLLTFNFLAEAGWHSRIAQYLRENLTDYPTGTDAASRYIDERIGPDECLFMVPLYTNVEQMFYHPDHTFCGLVSERARFVEENRARLRPDLFFERAIPDWFIVGGRSDDRFRRFLDQTYGPGSYALVAMLPVYWRNATRPEILWRSFGPVDVGVSSKNRILVFRRTAAPAHVPRADAFEVGRLLMY